MINIEIKPMCLLDLDELSDSLFSEFDDFWSVNVFREELQNPNSTYIVAKCDNTILGFAGIWQAVDTMHITNIVTKKDKRNLGIASLLLAELINITKYKKIPSLTLEVKDSNIPAINLYKKFEFQTMGIRKNYYNNCEDAIIMTKTLI